MVRICDIGECGLIARIEKMLSKPFAGVISGPGDDAAVLQALGPAAIVSCDMLIEDVDFKRAWASARDIGHKSAAINLSDLAAMGATPRGLLAAVALQPTEDVNFVLTLLKSLDATGRRFGAPLVGGDFSKTAGPLVVSVTALGAAPAKRALARHAAGPGDVVMVSGTVGGAALALQGLLTKKPVPQALRRAQLRPEPRVTLGLVLGRCRDVHACADVSDGLAKDALHLPKKGCGVHLETSRLPMARGLSRLSPEMAEQLALAGGEDFELVFAVAKNAVARVSALARRAGVAVTPIGRIIAKPGLWINERRPRTPARGAGGFDHFVI